MIDNTPYNGTT